MTIQDKEKIITQWKYKYNLLPSAHRATSILLDKGLISKNEFIKLENIITKAFDTIYENNNNYILYINLIYNILAEKGEINDDSV